MIWAALVINKLGLSGLITHRTKRVRLALQKFLSSIINSGAMEGINDNIQLAKEELAGNEISEILKTGLFYCR